jgi:hypothetical protein
MTAQRQQFLQAMGVTLYRRRGAIAAATPATMDMAVSTEPAFPADATTPALVMVGRREDRLHAGIVLRALAVQETSVHWIDATADKLSALPPDAAVFLAIGEAMARPLGAELSTELQQRACIGVTTAPAQWRSASGKRALWQVLKPLRRRLTS